MSKENQSVREKAKAERVTLWQIAEYLGISEPTITRWLRVPLTEEKAKRIYEAIAALAALAEGGGDDAEAGGV